MPELPEVETMVRGVAPAAEGRVIQRMEFCRCRRKPVSVSPDRRIFARRVRRTTIRSVKRLAKRVVFHLDNGLHMVVEPRMTGLLLITDPPTTLHRRICWHLEPEGNRPDSIEFWDRRGLGTARLMEDKELAELQSRLGPDALEISADLLRQRLSKTARPVKVAMLDQKLLAGIGNLYASEILHRARVSPRKQANRLTRKQCQRIADATHEVLTDAIRYEGSTLGDGTYRNVLNQDGSYQNKHRVYQKAAAPCPVCETPIQRIVQAQRSTFFCPRCQRD